MCYRHSFGGVEQKSEWARTAKRWCGENLFGPYRNRNFGKHSKKGELFREADREMIEKGSEYFLKPSRHEATCLTRIRLNRLIEENAHKAIEVHPTSTRKALQMPSKDWKAIQKILKTRGLKGESETHPSTTHEIDAIAAALTAVIHLKNQTERVGDDEEGYVILPKKRDWRPLTA
jgi:predicted nuclease with RNAse H fold